MGERPRETTTLLLGADATESALRLHSAKAGLLHLATHGFVEAEPFADVDSARGGLRLRPSVERYLGGHNRTGRRVTRLARPYDAPRHWAGFAAYGR